jgi:hypothetical protein
LGQWLDKAFLVDVESLEGQREDVLFLQIDRGLKLQIYVLEKLQVASKVQRQIIFLQ